MRIDANTSSEKVSMWYEALPEEKSWATALWGGYIICRCRGIRLVDSQCPVCGDPPPSGQAQLMRFADGEEVLVSPTFMGAEGRFEDWVYLRMIEHEWKRPVLDTDRFPGFFWR